MKVLSFDCGTVNLAWCLYDADKQARILDWQMLDLQLLKQSTKKPICEVLITFLDQKPVSDWFQIKPEDAPTCHVVIEKQPFRNSAAKAIEATLYNYFIIRGRIDALCLDRICVFSAIHKLAGEKVLRGKKAYRERKLKSVEVAAQLNVVKESPIWRQYLVDLSKKDDVCDALLQAVAYVQQNSAGGTSHTDVESSDLLRRVIARKPKTGLPASEYTSANCKYVLKKWLYPRLRKDRAKALELLPTRVKEVALLDKVITDKFQTLNNAIRVLKL